MIIVHIYLTYGMAILSVLSMFRCSPKVTNRHASVSSASQQKHDSAVHQVIASLAPVPNSAPPPPPARTSSVKGAASNAVGTDATAPHQHSVEASSQSPDGGHEVSHGDGDQSEIGLSSTKSTMKKLVPARSPPEPAVDEIHDVIHASPDIDDSEHSAHVSRIDGAALLLESSTTDDDVIAKDDKTPDNIVTEHAGQTDDTHTTPTATHANPFLSYCMTSLYHSQ